MPEYKYVRIIRPFEGIERAAPRAPRRLLVNNFLLLAASLFVVVRVGFAPRPLEARAFLEVVHALLQSRKVLLALGPFHKQLDRRVHEFQVLLVRPIGFIRGRVEVRRAEKSGLAPTSPSRDCINKFSSEVGGVRNPARPVHTSRDDAHRLGESRNDAAISESRLPNSPR